MPTPGRNRLYARFTHAAGVAKSSRRASGFVVVVVLFSGLVVAALGAAAAPARTVTLRVMTFNIFYGGDELDLTSRSWCFRPDGCVETLDQVVATIRASGADVVGLQEGVMNAPRIAEALGWYASERMQIVSRYPLIDPPGGSGLYIFVEPLPGRIAALGNVHLPADPYGPYEVRDGAPLEAVLELEEALRLPALRRELAALPSLASSGIPVFLTGDFNTPSHLDWTAAVAEVRSDVRYPVDWPVSKALEAAGFRDSFREVHRDPFARPGFTWTPGSPEGVKPAFLEVHDRIDWVLTAGPSRAIASQVVGEAGNADVDIAVHPWPSDHRGVVSSFDVQLASMPALVAVDRRSLYVGETLGVRFHGTARPSERVALVPAGGSPPSAVVSQSTDGATDRTIAFDTSALTPGAYETILVSRDDRVAARIPFWLYPPGTPTHLTTSKLVYAQGEPILVSWMNARGMKWDWLGLFEPAANDGSPIATTCFSGYCGNGHYLFYEYTDASIEGTAAFTESSAPGYGSWPLRPGTYEIRLLLDDGYRSVASSAAFKVVLG